MVARKKYTARIKSSMRLTAEEADQANTAAARIGLTGRNEYFLWLHKKYMKQQDEAEEHLQSLLDHLENHLDRKLRQIGTATQVSVALLDVFIKYVASTLPEVPGALREGAVKQGERIYERITRAAMREFKLRRTNNHYEPEQFEELMTESDDGMPVN